MLKKLTALIMVAMLAATMTACQGNTQQSAASSQTQSSAAVQNNDSNTASNTSAKTGSNGAVNTADLFTSRDTEQSADLTDAKTYTLSDGKDISITAAGVYVLKGSAKDVTVTVEAGDEDKVQIVLDGVSLTNADAPAIYVKNADKVFVTTTDSKNSLSVTGTFTADGETNTDAVIFSKDDLVLNGKGTLTVNSTQNGITSKDELKITGGTYSVTASADAFEANDSVAISDGNITVKTDKDGIHVENSDDDSKGSFYMGGGSLNITAGDDGIHATTVAQFDGGTITVSAAEGVEATYVQVNDGKISIDASDDGINAANKSSAYSTKAEFNGGEITINMGQGDTDGIDSNGDLIINGGTFNINAQSPFDYDGTAEKNGGTITVNGEATDEITNQFGGNGGMGGPGGMRGNGGMGNPDGMNGQNNRGGMGGQPPMQNNAMSVNE